MTALVLDASASVEMLLQTEPGRRLARAIEDATLWVPEHFFVEVSAVLRRLALLEEITAARASLALDEILAAPLRRVQIRPLLSEAWSLRANCTVADAIYVVLARHLRAALVTADLQLANAPTIGVQTITP